MRVWALWGQRISVGAFLATMFVACSLVGGLGHSLSGAPYTGMVACLHPCGPAKYPWTSHCHG